MMYYLFLLVCCLDGLVDRNLFRVSAVRLVAEGDNEPDLLATNFEKEHQEKVTEMFKLQEMLGKNDKKGEHGTDGTTTSFIPSFVPEDLKMLYSDAEKNHARIDDLQKQLDNKGDSMKEKGRMTEEEMRIKMLEAELDNSHIEEVHLASDARRGDKEIVVDRAIAMNFHVGDDISIGSESDAVAGVHAGNYLPAAAALVQGQGASAGADTISLKEPLKGDHKTGEQVKKKDILGMSLFMTTYTTTKTVDDEPDEFDLVRKLHLKPTEGDAGEEEILAIKDMVTRQAHPKFNKGRKMSSHEMNERFRKALERLKAQGFDPMPILHQYSTGHLDQHRRRAPGGRRGDPLDDTAAMRTDILTMMAGATEDDEDDREEDRYRRRRHDGPPEDDDDEREDHERRDHERDDRDDRDDRERQHRGRDDRDDDERRDHDRRSPDDNEGHEKEMMEKMVEALRK
eukprot:TRINITY_DN111261_c0_g1_i1.p1 TRINITY_DN111261_c0_g1~~TRINITY_DN111261_c0_g1_i1.p1  ORF type:complete len:455 (-),score=124.27 TRINITY_DN111261_c0_g1_i1:24-1388(-)